MSATRFEETFVAWARREPSVAALVLIGSQCRVNGGVASADRFSDWDYQVVTSRPELFSDRSWIQAAGLPEPLAYTARLGRLARVGKVTAMFPQADLDLVLLPAVKMRFACWVRKLGLGSLLARNPALGELALVLRPGHRVIKGGPGWERIFDWFASAVPPPRIHDSEVVAIAEGFVCDYVSTHQKIARGELLAAQRWLHANLAEANFRLVHELRLRQGKTTFPDARRIEALGDLGLVTTLAVRATPDRDSLLLAVERSGNTCRETVAALIGGAWRWPEGLASRLGRK